MSDTPKRPKTPKTAPAEGTVAATVVATLARLRLTDTQGAAYLGVPVTTLRKWIAGEREPAAAVGRLLEVMGAMEALAPSLHETFMPRVHVGKVYVEQVKPTMEVQS